MWLDAATSAPADVHKAEARSSVDMLVLRAGANPILHPLPSMLAAAEAQESVSNLCSCPITSIHLPQLRSIQFRSPLHDVPFSCTTSTTRLPLLRRLRGAPEERTGSLLVPVWPPLSIITPTGAVEEITAGLPPTPAWPSALVSAPVPQRSSPWLV